MKNEKMYGYVRVSSKDQNEARQLIAMREYGISEENIFMDKISGKDFNRPSYKKLITRMDEGDVMVVKSIDRLGRNYEDIIEQWNLITKKKKCSIAVIDMPLLDTRGSRDLTGTLISDIVLQLLSYVAQTERENIRQRQAEGIQAAIERGVKFGRRQIEMPDEFYVLKEKWKKGEISSREAGKYLGISHQTFLRKVKQMQKLSGQTSESVLHIEKYHN